MLVDWVHVYASGAGAPTILKAPNDSGTTLTAGAGAYTLIASHGADTLVAGSGQDTFEFPVLPWSAGHIKGFVTSTDKIDVSALFAATNYTGHHPFWDGYLSRASDGHGGTDVYFNPHDGSTIGVGYLITDVDGVAPKDINLGDVTYADSTVPAAPNVAIASTGSFGGVSARATTLQATGDNGTTLTAGAGAVDLVASHGPDTLVAGSGVDTFDFPVIPWSAGQVKGFVSGRDVLDLRPLFKAADYNGTNPLSDHHIDFQSDGHGGTKVWFDPHPGSDNPFLITTLDNISPASLAQSHDWLWH
jgi:Ca2+-binding RTX toxin-like protein